MSAHIIRRAGALTLIIAAAGLASCAPRTNASLERAGMEVQNLQRDPAVTARASELVDDAAATYALAENEWRRTKDYDEVSHLVYITTRKVELAREEARRELALEAAEMERTRARAEAGRLATTDAEARARMSERQAETYRILLAENRALVDRLSRQVAKLSARETDRGLELGMGSDVLFETDQATLKPGAILNIRPVAEFLRAQPGRAARIEGHTDNVGDSAYNQDLSQRRADAVRDMLVSEGVPPERVEARGVGESYPLASNASEAGRLQNRRVQIILSPAAR